MTEKAQLNTPFIKKLHQIMTNPQFADIICWDSTGIMIDILDDKRIQIEVLPKFFRHSKYESFIRQLNLYGFKKMKKTNVQRFKHPDLTKGSSLYSIKSQRKLKLLRETREQNRFQNENNQFSELQQINQAQRQSSQVEQERTNKKQIENNGSYQNWMDNSFNNMLLYAHMNYQNQLSNLCFNGNNNSFGQMTVHSPMSVSLNPMAANLNNLYFYN